MRRNGLKTISNFTSADNLKIDTGDVESLSLPFNMIATVDGAGHI
jgi:hypothetical protein